MPADTPDESTLTARRIGVAVIGLLILVLGVLAGRAVWGLLSGQGISLAGWIYIISFTFAVIGFVPMVRQVRKPPPAA